MLGEEPAAADESEWACPQCRAMRVAPAGAVRALWADPQQQLEYVEWRHPDPAKAGNGERGYRCLRFHDGGGTPSRPRQTTGPSSRQPFRVPVCAARTLDSTQVNPGSLHRCGRNTF